MPMPRRARTTARPKRKARAGARAVRGFRRAFRKVGTAMPTFTEMFRADDLTNTGGGTFQYSISQVPQIASYTALYRQYRILGAKVILLPRQVTNTTGGVASTDFGIPSSIMYAINDSSDSTPPASQIEVLESNGAKTRLLNKPVKIAFKPVADINVNANNAGGNVVPINLPSTFISLDLNGPQVVHRGVDFWYQCNSTGQHLPVEVYVKLTFQLRDPR